MPIDFTNHVRENTISGFECWCCWTAYVEQMHRYWCPYDRTCFCASVCLQLCLSVTPAVRPFLVGTQNTSFQKHKTKHPFLFLETRIFLLSCSKIIVCSNWQHRNTSFSILVNEFLGRFLYRNHYKKQETRFFLIFIIYKSNFYEFPKT